MRLITAVPLISNQHDDALHVCSLSKINTITDLAVKIREDLLCMIHPRRRG